MKFNIEDSKKIIKISILGQELEWDKWSEKIPYIQWPSDWLVKAIPPVITGIIRYNIKHKDKPKSFCSVYLDCYDIAAFYGSPYWEIYPVEGDCHRCDMKDTESLLKAIKKSLKEQ